MSNNQITTEAEKTRKTGRPIAYFTLTLLLITWACVFTAAVYIKSHYGHVVTFIDSLKETPEHLMHVEDMHRRLDRISQELYIQQQNINAIQSHNEKKWARFAKEQQHSAVNVDSVNEPVQPNLKETPISNTKTTAHLEEEDQDILTEELSELMKRTSDLEEHVNTLKSLADQAQKHESINAMIIAATNLQKAVQSAQSYEYELDVLSFFGDHDPKIIDIITPMVPYAKTGISNYKHLQNSFQNQIHESLSHLPKTNEESPIQSSFMNYVHQLVKIRKIAPSASDELHDPELVIAKIEQLLEEAEIEAAITLLDTLPESMQEVYHQWRKDADIYVTVTKQSEAVIQYINNMLYPKST